MLNYLDDRSPGTRSIVGAALLAVGGGLLGMTAGELPGIPAHYGIPRWLMGAVAGVLLSAGYHWVTSSPERPAPGVGRPAALLIAMAAAVAVATGNGYVLPEGVAAGVNTLGRIAFLLGAGMLLGTALRARARRARERRTGLPLDG